MNYSVSGRKLLWPSGGTVVEFCWTDKKKYADTCRHSRCSGGDSNRAPTEHLSLQRDHYTNLLGVTRIMISCVVRTNMRIDRREVYSA